MKKGNKVNTGGKPPKITKVVEMSSNIKTSLESKKGSEPLRNNPAVSDLSKTNTVLISSKKDVGMTGFSQPLTTEPIHKKRVQKDNNEEEIEI
jgi:hypothetical protein